MVDTQRTVTRNLEEAYTQVRSMQDEHDKLRKDLKFANSRAAAFKEENERLHKENKRLSMELNEARNNLDKVCTPSGYNHIPDTPSDAKKYNEGWDESNYQRERKSDFENGVAVGQVKSATVQSPLLGDKVPHSVVRHTFECNEGDHLIFEIRKGH